MPTIQLFMTETEIAALEGKSHSTGFSGIEPYLRFLAFPPKWVQTPEQRAEKLAIKVKWFVESHPCGCSRRDIARFIGGKTKTPQLDTAIAALLDSGDLTVKREKRTRKSTNYYYKA